MSVNKLRKIINENESHISLPISELKNLIEGFNEKTVKFEDILIYLQKHINAVEQENFEKNKKKNDEYSNFQTVKGEAKELITNVIKELRYNEKNSIIKSIIQQFVHNYEGDAGEALENLEHIFKETSVAHGVLERIKPKLAPHKWKAPTE